jgi:multiple sugar transport system permease protein
MKPGKKISENTSKILVNLVLIIILLIVISPFIWMVGNSLMNSGESSTFPPKFIPSEPTLVQYEALFKKLNFSRNLINSLIVSISITIISLFINSLAGFAFAKYRFKGKDKVFKILLATLAIPGQLTMLPVFLILNKMHLLNSYWGLIVTGSASVYAIFLFKQFLQSIPDDLIEAARIDGCSDFKIYWKIIIPLAKPALITLAIFTFMASWNDFLWPLIVMSKESMYTLPVALANLFGDHIPDTELMMAGSVITILPVLIIFLFLQKYYIGGIMTGGIKE